jgi:phosphoglucomutase
MSGTGSVGATVRLYVEKYEGDSTKVDADPQDALRSLVELALSTSQLAEFTKRDRPTVIT